MSNLPFAYSVAAILHTVQSVHWHYMLVSLFTPIIHLFLFLPFSLGFKYFCQNIVLNIFAKTYFNHDNDCVSCIGLFNFTFFILMETKNDWGEVILAPYFFVNYWYTFLVRCTYVPLLYSYSSTEKYSCGKNYFCTGIRVLGYLLHSCMGVGLWG